MINCPICKGTGLLDDPKHMDIDVLEVKKEMAIKLRDKGFSLRQIQKVLGYKSVRSVDYLLKSKDSSLPPQ